MDVDDDENYTILNRTPGADTDVHSFRSELVGILANVLFIQSIVKTHDIHTGRVTVACDNESALWACFGDGPVKATDSSFDLIRVIRHAIKHSTIQWATQHVKGHQDKDKNALLDEWAHANIEADRLAGEYWDDKYGSGNRNRPTPGPMPGEGWRITIDRRPITTHVEQQLYEQMYRDRMVSYWERKQRLALGQSTKVEWEQYYGALQLTTKARRQWTQKHFCGFEGNNYMMHKWGQRSTDTCPNCAEKETHRHVLQCQSDRATKAYRNTERNFETWLKDTTSRDIRRAIMAHLDSYREQEGIEEPEDLDAAVAQASRNQAALGHNAFAEGFLIKDWEQLQASYLTTTTSKRSPSRWVKELIKKLWNVSWDMWDSRNAEVHQKTQTRRDIIIEHLHTEIQTHLDIGQTNEFLPRLERTFFRTTVEEVTRQTEYQKRLWLHIAKRYIERDNQRVARNRSIQIMREWLQPGSTTAAVRRRKRTINRSDNNMRGPEGWRRGPLGSED